MENYMRVAVIAPPYPLEEAPAPPLGVCYVAAAFEQAGAEVRIFDFVVSGYNKEKIQKAMDEFKPHVVGSTSVTMSFPQAAQIITDVKEIDPSVYTIMGGPHVSFWAHETLEKFPAVDCIVIGEGEQTIEEITPLLAKGETLENVTGLILRHNGEIVETGHRDFIQDLDSLPMPARHLLPLSRYKALGFPVSIITSRGCPNKCIFCLGRRMVGHKVRYRSVKKVVDEIETLLELGFTRINVADDLFTSNKKRVREVCNEIKNRGLKFGWSAFSRVNTADKETFALMRETGCDCVSFGIESGNQEMLKRVKKGITLAQAEKAVKICKEVGILPHASFMVGLPGETHETMADSARFAKKLDAIYGYHFLAPFPGTTVLENLEEYDLEILTDDWSLYDANRPVVRTSQVSPQDAIDFVGRFEKECEEEWKRLEEGFGKGVNSPEDDLRVEGTRKVGGTFQILEEDLVEQCGVIPADLAKIPEKALSFLVDAIAGRTGRDHAMVESIVVPFYKNGHIRIVNGGDDACWAWTPNPGQAA